MLKVNRSFLHDTYDRTVPALTLPDKKPSQQKSYAEDPEGDDPLDPELGLYNGKDDKCPCKKDDREEKEKKQREKEIQFQINFEDALHNQVYVKR